MTAEGLWLSSTADEDKDKATHFRVRAMAIGRETGNPVRLSSSGETYATKEIATWLRPGLLEEYRPSMDGIRQDFVVPVRPAGEGELAVSLELTGVRAEAAAYGAKLTVEGSGRELAYSRLHVTDATGRKLSAKLVVRDAATLEVHVNDRGATYPLRIDPTFSDADWVSMADVPGVGGSANAIALNGSGNLYVAGSFQTAGNVIANYIAKWDGSTWSTLDSGMSGRQPLVVYALRLDASGNLYAGGSFSAVNGVSANNIAKWDGNSWSALGPGVELDGKSPRIRCRRQPLRGGGWAKWQLRSQMERQRLEHIGFGDEWHRVRFGCGCLRQPVRGRQFQHGGWG